MVKTAGLANISRLTQTVFFFFFFGVGVFLLLFLSMIYRMVQNNIFSVSKNRILVSLLFVVTNHVTQYEIELVIKYELIVHMGSSRNLHD